MVFVAVLARSHSISHVPAVAGGASPSMTTNAQVEAADCCWQARLQLWIAGCKSARTRRGDRFHVLFPACVHALKLYVCPKAPSVKAVKKLCWEYFGKGASRVRLN